MEEAGSALAVRRTDIAMVGMAAHLPGAGSVAAYRAMPQAGREAIRRLTPDDLRAAGESAARMKTPTYAPAAAVLDGFETFAAAFLSLSPIDAAIMDPRHRQFLECAWEAFEDAGHPPETFGGRIGVFASCGMGSYVSFNLCSNPDLVKNTGMFLLRHMGPDKDSLPTRVSHIFNLKGPSISVQTACSTGLVAVHRARQSLPSDVCDMAIAGVTPDTIAAMECHGTGPCPGDPIRVAALTEADRRDAVRSGYCRIGSVKTNIGHPDTAACSASLITATLARHHGEMPPS